MLEVVWRAYERLLRTDGGADSFPTRQLFVLALCRICEPIAFMSIFPYAYRMIESFNVAKDSDHISIYAGMLITSFAFAEFSTGVIWGRISDRVGRKPVLIFGLVGTALSMVLFGFATNLRTAVIARALGGLLNGNVGVLQTTVAELVTVKEHQPRAYSIMPFVWCLGSIIGPVMGGALAQPCTAYPWLFESDSIFGAYPFLLPNLVCVVILLFGIAIGILFLEETHADKKHQSDWGRKLGNVLLQKAFGGSSRFGSQSETALHSDQVTSVATDELPPGYRSTKGSPRISSIHRVGDSAVLDVESHQGSTEERAMIRIFSKQVILVIVGYGILAYHSVSFDILMPLFLSEPISHRPPHLPFKFTGGFAMSTKTIGSMMAIQGIYSMVAQLFLFPFLVRKIGTLRTFRFVMLIWPLLYFVVPYMVLLPSPLQKPAIYASLLIKITFHVIAFPSTAMLIANAAPSKSVLGSINGVAASIACLARALGPTLTGILHTAGLKMGYNGIAWWIGGVVCALGAIESFWMEEVDARTDRLSEEEEQPVCEPLLHALSVDGSADDMRRMSLDSVEHLDLCKGIIKA